MNDQTEIPEVQGQTPGQGGADFAAIPGQMVEVIRNPVGFYKQMPKTGGFVEPLVFMVAMAVLTAVVLAIAGMVGFGPVGMMAMGFVGLIILPIMVAIFGFVGAAIMFVIWKIMGSNEDFETAYRCVAYSYSYAPVAALVSGIPYLGTLVSTLWPMALMAIASMHVHGRSQGLSWGVFGVLGLLFALSSLSIEMAAHKMQSGMQDWSQQMEQKMGNPDEMTPEEAGKAVGDFLKGMQQMQQKEP
ncbi:MAG: YIP1 family protein [Mariprofundaceae bacterium]